jgi:preprotein translocase subunit SecB
MTEKQAKFTLKKFYVKDLSFETPNTPQMFTEEWEPDMDLQLANRSSVLGDDHYEVILQATVTAKLKDKIAYLVEVHMAGIFQLVDLSEEAIKNLTNNACCQLLFPYVREVVSDVVIRGGFPPMLLQPINFDALYQHHLQQIQFEQQGESKH